MGVKELTELRDRREVGGRKGRKYVKVNAEKRRARRGLHKKGNGNPVDCQENGYQK